MRLLLLVAILPLTTAFAALAQNGPPVPPVPPHQLTEAEKKFDADVRSLEKTLRAARAYSVEAVCDWTSTGNGADRSGKNTLRILVAQPNKVRIEAIGDSKGGETSLLVVGDGKHLTRMFPERKLYHTTPTTKTIDDLQTDALTRHSLRGSGVDFLLRTDLIGTVLAQTVSVTDLGEITAEGKKFQAFQLGLADGRKVEVRFTAGQPMPVEIRTVMRIPLADQKSFVLTMHTRLKWNLDPNPADDAFTVKLPEGARAVKDLMEALLEGDVSALVGKPVPALTFARLDGGKADLLEHKGKGVVVLYFWATWAAPSIADMPGLNKFIEAYSAKGVTFLAVAVGENPADVKTFLAKEGYKGQVYLDPKAQALATLKTNALPAVMLIGKDGTLQAYHRGARPGLREQIQQDLDRLLKGEKLAPNE